MTWGRVPCLPRPLISRSRTPIRPRRGHRRKESGRRSAACAPPRCAVHRPRTVGAAGPANHRRVPASGSAPALRATRCAPAPSPPGRKPSSSSVHDQRRPSHRRIRRQRQLTGRDLSVARRTPKEKGLHREVQAFDLHHSGRDGRIRTDDPLPPRQMRYQAALRPECLRCTPLFKRAVKYSGSARKKYQRRSSCSTSSSSTRTCLTICWLNCACSRPSGPSSRNRAPPMV